jgi:predicted nuclease with TOPRIM domain
MTDAPDDVDEYNRDERIETIYQGLGAREMAERIVDLENELGEDVDGICTGMHADVAEARAEVERLTSLVGYWEHRAEESDRLREHAGSLYEMFKRLRDEESDRSERYRSAWLSARRRAADEANFGMEALELRDAEIRRLKAPSVD